MVIPSPPLHRPTESKENLPNLRGSHFNHLLLDTGIISYFRTHFDAKNFLFWEIGMTIFCNKGLIGQTLSFISWYFSFLFATALRTYVVYEKIWPDTAPSIDLLGYTIIILSLSLTSILTGEKKMTQRENIFDHYAASRGLAKPNHCPKPGAPALLLFIYLSSFNRAIKQCSLHTCWKELNRWGDRER